MPHVVYKSIDLAFMNAEDWNVAFGAVLGLQLGLISPLTLQWLCALLCTILFRANFLSGAVLCFAGFLVGLYADPVFHLIGLKILTTYPNLYSFWGWAYHVPVLPYSSFNNTVVMGQTVTAYILSVPLFLFTLHFSGLIRKRLGNMWYSTKISRTHAHYGRVHSKK